MDRTRVCAMVPCPNYATGGEKYCAKHLQDNTRTRADAARRQSPHRKLYAEADWKGPRGLRQWVLKRDVVCTCQEKDCHGEGRCYAWSDTVDHVVDHGGDRALFYSRENVAGKCKACHDRRTGREHGFGGKP
ncbi:MAG: hypothetical protein WA542_00680 [Candidatus Acidiferrum sp.]